MKTALYIPPLPPLGKVPEVLDPDIWEEQGIRTETMFYDFVHKNEKTKLDAWLERIGQRFKQLGRTGLILPSGAAAPGLIAYTEYSEHVDWVALVCAKVNGMDKIQPDTFDTYQNYQEPTERLSASLDLLDDVMRKNVFSARSEKDGIVRDPRDSVLEGSHEFVLPTLGHMASMAYILDTREGSSLIANFAHQH